MIKNKLKSITKVILKKIKSFDPPKIVSFLFILFPIFFGFIKSLVLDNDFWFLVTTGKFIVKNGFPLIEPFTIHKNFEFIAQQWLTDVIYYYIHAIFGGWGIVIFTMLQFLIIIYLIYKLCILVSENRFNLSIILTTVASLLLTLCFVRSRPQMFDFIILLTQLYLLELYVRKKEKKYLCFLPILSLLLINLHSSTWLMLFMFILPYIISSKKFKIICFESEGYEKKPLLISTIFMALAGFINPYGIKAITYLFTSYGDKYINLLVAEMNIPKLNTVYGIFIYTSIFIVLFCYLINKKDNIKLRYFFLFLGTTVLTLTSIKGYSFFIIASIFPLADYFKRYFKIYKEKYHYSTLFKIEYSIIIIIFIMFIILYIKKSHIDFYRTNISKTVKYLENAEKINKKTTKIYTGYDDGSFAEYSGLRVYLDPRAEVFLKKNNKRKDVIKEYYELQIGRISIDKFLKNYDFDYLIVNKKDYIYLYFLNTKQNVMYKKIYKEEKTNSIHYLYKKVEN